MYAELTVTGSCQSHECQDLEIRLMPISCRFSDSGEEKDWEVSENLQRTPDALPFLISPPQLPGEKLPYLPKSQLPYL